MKMKKPILLLACVLAVQIPKAQLKSTPFCPAFTVDVLDGSVNKLYPESPYQEIKNRLPCYTNSIDEPSATGCAGVFFKDKGIDFYTYRDYIEISMDFKGKLTLPILGADRGSLFKWLGLPKAKDNGWEAYQMQHGIIVVYFDAIGKVNKIQSSSRTPETMRVCE
jgi:hypothetical protein